MIIGGREPPWDSGPRKLNTESRMMLLKSGSC